MFATLEKNDTEKLKTTLERITFRTSVETRRFSSALELGETAFALRVVHPCYSGDDLIGYVEMGEEIDHFLRLMKDQKENEYGILAFKAYLDREDWASVREIKGLRNNWDDHEHVLLINQTSPQMESMMEFELDINAAGETVGAVFVLRNVTQVQREVVFQQVSVIFIIVFIMAIFAIPLLRR